MSQTATQNQTVTKQDVTEMLVAPIENEAHHRQVCESLDQARRASDHPGIMILLAQLAHSQSWRPEPAEGIKTTEATS